MFINIRVLRLRSTDWKFSKWRETGFLVCCPVILLKMIFFLTVCAGMGGKSDCRENKFSGLPFGQSH